MSLVKCSVVNCPHKVREGLRRPDYKKGVAGQRLADGRTCWRCRARKRAQQVTKGREMVEAFFDKWPEARRAKLFLYLKVFFDEFPDDAKSWAQATDELSDMYRWLTVEHNHGRKDGLLQPVGGKINYCTPALWNRKYKAAILGAIKVVDDEVLRRFSKRFGHWFKRAFRRAKAVAC